MRDQDAAKAFYQEKLGFQVLNDSPFGEGQRWVQLAPAGGAQASIALVNWFGAMPPGSVRGLVLHTDDIAAARADLEAKGVAVEEVMDTPWGKFARFSDPDGNGWSLHEG